MGMTYKQAKLASEKLCDVFTPDGDAVTIESIARVYVIVSGGTHYQERYRIDDLTPCRDCTYAI